MATSRIYSDEYAYDLSNQVITEGELYDVDVINQSIENILTTSYGERLFNPFYGSILPLVTFEEINVENGEEILDRIIQDVEAWEDRIVIISEEASLVIVHDDNTIRLSIPYTIIKNNITSKFDKKVLL